MPDYGIAFGSNLGDRLGNFRTALALLTRDLPPTAVQRSPVYATEPVDCPPGSPEFFNAVVTFSHPMPVGQMFVRRREVEKALGRRPAALREPGEPRAIDLDLLFAGDTVTRTPELTLPHPRLHQRRFVLQPLCDLHPGLLLPGLDATVAELLARLPEGDAPLTLVTRHWP
jgi:2-amino-4-hydroxy-6-hydroxymethyldihydropteridine diphosphokinase